MTEPTLITIDLTDDEREFMLSVLSEFEGPASYTPFPINILGISTSDEFDELLIRLRRAIARKEALPELDWARAAAHRDVLGKQSDRLGAGLRHRRRRESPSVAALNPAEAVPLPAEIGAVSG